VPVIPELFIVSAVLQGHEELLDDSDRSKSPERVPETPPEVPFGDGKACETPTSKLRAGEAKGPEDVTSGVEASVDALAALTRMNLLGGTLLASIPSGAEADLEQQMDAVARSTTMPQHLPGMRARSASHSKPLLPPPTSVQTRKKRTSSASSVASSDGGSARHNGLHSEQRAIPSNLGGLSKLLTGGGLTDAQRDGGSFSHLHSPGGSVAQQPVQRRSDSTSAPSASQPRTQPAQRRGGGGMPSNLGGLSSLLTGGGLIDTPHGNSATASRRVSSTPQQQTHGRQRQKQSQLQQQHAQPKLKQRLHM